MILPFDLYWSFSSSYCYLALDRILAINKAYEVEVNVRPIYPHAIRNPDFSEQVHPNYRSYHALDRKRVAEFLGIPYRSPVPSPLKLDPESDAALPDQPHIFRLTRLGTAAALAGRGLPYVDQVSRILWDRTVEGWDQNSHLADAVARAGLDLSVLDRQIAENAAAYDTIIEESQNALRSAGHWGVPTIVFGGEPFHGQDRIELLVWRMRQNGLRKRV